MLIFLRHQRGDPHINCLNIKGFNDTKQIADVFGVLKNLNVYTCCSKDHKHIRPLQTASIVCTYLDKNVNVVESIHQLPKDCTLGNHIFIWHHSEIQHLVRMYCDLIEPLYWDADDYYRAILVDNERIINIPDFRKINIVNS